MKHPSQILLLFAIFINNIFCQETKTLTEIKNFGSNPGNLKMFIHNVSPEDTCKLPLVVVLHGCGQHAKGAAELTGWNKLADINNFVVLYPQQKLVNNPNLCFNWFSNQDIEKGQGESESIFQMISFVRQHYSIDSNRIYITGLSAGAAMSVVMTATHPELFKSGAIFAGAPYKIARNPIDGAKAMLGNKYIPREKLVKDFREQNPDYRGRYPTLIVYQGLNDPVVNYKSTKLLIDQWTGINESDTIPEKVETAFMGIEDITRKEYSDSLGRTILILYEVDNLGHGLLVKPGEGENEGGQTGIFGVDKGFHSTYQTAKEFGIIKNN
jgi:poly(hydroxyalkanoate) depolymerase family esterase